MATYLNYTAAGADILAPVHTTTTVFDLHNGDTPYEKAIVTSIPQQPVTKQRQPYNPPQDSTLINAGTARATIAASAESPNGTTEGNFAKEHQDETVLIQHVSYWDRDADGIIWPQDTYRGVRAWGWNPLLSLIVTLVIHGGLSYATVPGLLPDPFFRIWVPRIHKAKHGSDSVSFDNEGRFRPQNFEDIFAKYDRGSKGGLSKADVFDFWNGQRMVMDFFGATAVALEWTATYLLLWPVDGIMRKDEIRRVFDGSIFYKKAEDYERAQEERRQGLSSTSRSLVARVKKMM